MPIILEKNYRGFQIRRHDHGNVAVVCATSPEGTDETYRRLGMRVGRYSANYPNYHTNSSCFCVADGAPVMALINYRGSKTVRVRQQRMANIFRQAIDDLYAEASRNPDEN
ncbi:MAG: hypothetical protein HY516_00810 [Candidatus Aenigmarchaeota archaeon]|nr:hypothetical protein [Candidatus Aenigmarchaeota archaeon]